MSLTRVKESRWNHYRVRKPLRLLVLGGLTPPEWEISIVDEILGRSTRSKLRSPRRVCVAFGLVLFDLNVAHFCAYTTVSYTHLTLPTN